MPDMSRGHGCFKVEDLVSIRTLWLQIAPTVGVFFYALSPGVSVFEPKKRQKQRICKLLPMREPIWTHEVLVIFGHYDLALHEGSRRMLTFRVRAACLRGIREDE